LAEQLYNTKFGYVTAEWALLLLDDDLAY